MRRSFLLLCALSAVGAVYACSADDDSAGPEADAGTDTTSPDQPDTSTPPPDGGAPDADKGDANKSTGSPIEGASAATLVTPTVTVPYAEGPQYHAGAIYFGDYAGGEIVKCTAPNVCVHERATTTGLQPLGTTYDDKNKSFVTAEVDTNGTIPSILTRWAGDGGVATPLAVDFDGGAPWSDPNDLVIRSDGTIYLTDPAYQHDSLTNHVYMISPAGAATALLDFSQGERPNGIALSKDEKTLYISYTSDPAGPSIKKYAVNANGTLGPPAPFASVPPGSDLDGLAIDDDGNLYAAVKTGVDVFKADGTKWGSIAVPKQPNNVAFGGADRKTLYITTNEALYQVTGLKVPGVLR